MVLSDHVMHKNEGELNSPLRILEFSFENIHIDGMWEKNWP